MNGITLHTKSIALALILCPLLALAQYNDGNATEPEITLFLGGVELPPNASPKEKFNEYCRHIGTYDVALTMPTNYKSIHMDALSRISYFIHHPGNIHYPVGLQSDDQKAVILYPTVMLNFGTQSIQQGYNIEVDLRFNYNDFNLDVSPLVEIVSLNDMSHYSNADTVAFYELDLGEPNIPFMERYKHCIGVYLRKYGHPSLAMKLMLDDEGYKNKDFYIRQLLDNIQFGDRETHLTPYEKLIVSSDFKFPTEKIYPSGTGAKPSKEYKDALRSKWKAENDSLNRLPQ